MSDSIVYKFSDLIQDDGALEIVKEKFRKLGDDLVADAKRVKKELNDSFTLDADTIAKAEARVEELEKSLRSYKDAKKELEKVESDYNKAIQEQAKAEIAIERAKQAKINTVAKEISAERELDRAIQQNNNTKKSGIALTDAEARASAKLEKQKEREASAYLQLTAEYNKSFRVSADLGAQMFRLEDAGLKNTAAYDKLSRKFTESQANTIKFDKALKDLDGTLGRNFRKVGDYASGFNPLNNSVSQIVRELPSISGGFAIFASAIGNNIAPLADAIGQVKAQNEILKAEGKATQSVFKQLAGSIFSFNSLLLIGVTVLTVYGKEIGEFVKSLFGANAEFEKLNENQKKLNQARVEGLKASVEAETKLKENLNIAKDPNLDIIDRNIALKKLRDEYGYYFRNLTDEQILAGQTAGAENELRKAIEKRQQANRFSEVIVDNKQRIIALENEVKLQDKIIANRRSEFNQLSKINGINPNIPAKAAKELNEAQIKRIGIIQSVLDITVQNASYEEKILQLRKESIGLDYQADKAEKNKLLNQTKSIDYKASEYELNKLILENRIQMNEDVFKSDKYTTEQRLNAQKILVSQELELAKLNRDESLRILKNKYTEESTETIKDGDGKVLAKKYTNQALIELEKQYTFDAAKIQEEYRQAQIDANKKGEAILLLDKLNMDIAYLKNLQKSLSDRSDVYKAYAKEISAIQTQIDNIISGDSGIELSQKIEISQEEVDSLRAFVDSVNRTFKGKDLTNLTKRDQKIYLKLVEEYETKKSRIEMQFENQRREARIESIIREQEATDEQGDAYKKLELEKLALQKQIEQDRAKLALDTNKAILKNYKDFNKELLSIIGEILDLVLEINRKRIESDRKLLEDQKNAVQNQEERARVGAENTLAFEQKMQAQREANLAKSERKQQRLERIKALYSSYTNYANRGDDNAIAKALRDTAILQAIAASFGDGGAVDDVLNKMPQDRGIIRGRSHRGRQGGIPVLVEGKEGFFSGREMENLGKQNFYKIKERAGLGKVDSNFFSKHHRDFVQVVPNGLGGNHKVVEMLEELKTAIQSKPVSNWRVESVVDGTMKLVEQIETKNKTVRNTFIIKKPRP